jgi:folate-dependent phosphoribosylglycinamide formyltransferase PurN
MTLEPLYDGSGPMRVALFMSGSGSNACRIIEEYLRQKDNADITGEEPSFEIAAIFTDNLDSNATRIGLEDYVDQGLSLPVVTHPIRQFYEDNGAADDPGNKEVRARYDTQSLEMLAAAPGVGEIDMIALAGYDWVTTVSDELLLANVHPGDLRVSYEGGSRDGKRRYTGLGWVPSAKAILNGEPTVYTSVHVVTPGLDEGPLLAVSAPQDVPDKIRAAGREALLGEATGLGKIMKYVREHPDEDDGTLAAKFPIYGAASDCQERLKINGDWVVFPRVVDWIAQGRYAKDEDGALHLDNEPIPDGHEFS